jgi:hypothetical protein
VVRFSDTEVDFERRVVTRKGEDLKLTPAEYNLLCYFLQNPDRPLTRDMILNSVWGYEFFPNTRTVDAHVVKLRQKLEPDEPDANRFLRATCLTVHWSGIPDSCLNTRPALSDQILRKDLREFYVEPTSGIRPISDNNRMLPEGDMPSNARPVLVVEDSENSAAMLEIVLSVSPK